MSIKFNNLNNNYGNYNFAIGRNLPQEEVKKTEKNEEVVQQDSSFIGLEDDRDLLTQGNYVFVSQLTGKGCAGKEIADETNGILASLGYDYKVTEQQVKSVVNGVQSKVLPGLKAVEDGVVAAHIQDPNGPFAELFI